MSFFNSSSSGFFFSRRTEPSHISFFVNIKGEKLNALALGNGWKGFRERWLGHEFLCCRGAAGGVCAGGAAVERSVALLAGVGQAAAVRPVA